jgi:phosphoglycerol transferase MdoB-like AlkP superfamily enzyme
MNLPLSLPASIARRDLVRAGIGVLACVALVVVLIGQPSAPVDPDTLPLALGTRILLATLNVLPVLALGALLLALTRRVLLSSWIVLLALLALYAANTAKMRFVQTPLLPADLRFLTEPRPALELFSQYLHFDLKGALLALVVLAVTVLLWRERPWSFVRGTRRLILGAAAIVVCATLFAGCAPWRQLYQPARAGFHPWALSESVGQAGLVGSLLLYHWEVGGGVVPPADRGAAIALLKAHAPALRARLAAAGVAGDLPDIVIVQSESLFDPARLKDVPKGHWLPEYHHLQRVATSGNMHVPTFGGGTIRTEFEVLTGAPLASLGGIQYPWLELDRSNLPGLTSTLARHGYATLAIHPNSAAFWNRGRVFPNLGFERFIDVAAFPDETIVGLFPSDAALTDKILEELPADGPPRFLFAITMENHGPFDWRPNLDPKRLAALPMPDKLDAGGRLWYGNYLYLLDDADHELGRLVAALKQRERRTLLLFYGDHMPSLAPVYFQLGFDDGLDAKAQPVPWLLFDTANPRAAHADTRSWLLPAQLLDAAGIGDDAYFTVMDTLRTEMELGAQPADATPDPGIEALARLHLHGKFDAALDEALGAAVESR